MQIPLFTHNITIQNIKIKPKAFYQVTFLLENYSNCSQSNSKNESNQQVTKALCKRVGTSEAVRPHTYSKTIEFRQNIRFKPMRSIFPKSQPLFYCGFPDYAHILMTSSIKSNAIATQSIDHQINPIESMDLVRVAELHQAPQGEPQTQQAQNDIAWNQWLAGLIDGDGSLLISRAGFCCCEITMHINDVCALKQIKNKLGGSVKKRAGSKSVRYRLHNYKGLIALIHRINGHIRHSKRTQQLKAICTKYHIRYKTPNTLTKNNGWFSGFFDADGTITFSKKKQVKKQTNGSKTKVSENIQLSIRVTNKDFIDVEPFKKVFGGYIYYDKSQNGYYSWSVQSKKDILFLCDYFKNYPSQSAKADRLALVPEFYRLQSKKAFDLPINCVNKKAWFAFLKAWFYSTANDDAIDCEAIAFEEDAS
jgi:hypothetical protein